MSENSKNKSGQSKHGKGKHSRPEKGCESFLSATKSGTKIDYGTNNTSELLERIPSELVELKLDDVLTAVKTVDNLCDYPRCKAKTSLMGLNCEHCKSRFCFKHGLPEVHGCGEAIKLDERKKFLHPKPIKTVRHEQELAQAQKKLSSKLKNMQMERKQKPAGNNDAGSTRSKSGK